MTRATITRKIRVYDPTAGLPAPGAAALVAAAESFQSVRPAGITADNWRYSIFGSYGSGCFNPHYSTRGAYVLAGTGGHSHPATFGAIAFDFDTMQWAYLPAANGPADRNGPVSAAETSADPWWEMTGYPEVPSPPHPYQTQVVIPPSLGGGSKGSMLYVQRGSVDSGGVTSAPVAHAFDLVSRTWARRSAATNMGTGYEKAAIHDPVTNRFYLLPPDAHYLTALAYLDGTDWTRKTTESFSNGINAANIGAFINLFIHESGGKRILVAVTKTAMSGIDLANISAGWTQLTLSGTLQIDSSAPVFHAAKGVYYRRYGGQTDQVLTRITPPAGNPLTGTWVVDTVTLTGDAIPPHYPYTYVNSATSAYRNLMYIPALQMLGWVTAGGVALLNP